VCPVGTGRAASSNIAPVFHFRTPMVLSDQILCIAVGFLAFLPLVAGIARSPTLPFDFPEAVPSVHRRAAPLRAVCGQTGVFRPVCLSFFDL